LIVGFLLEIFKYLMQVLIGHALCLSININRFVTHARLTNLFLPLTIEEENLEIDI